MPQPPHIVASRRAALRLALAAAAALAGGAAQGQSPAPSGPAHLLVGDVSAAKLHVYAGPDWSLQATFDDFALGAHAGTLALADSREAVEQIAFADQIVLNKTDTVDEAQLQRVETAIRRLNPLAPIHRAERSNVPLDAILGRGGFDLERMADLQPENPAHGEQGHVHDDHCGHDHHHGHDHDPGHGPRRVEITEGEAGMGVGAADHRRMGEPLGTVVGDVSSGSRHEPRILDAPHRLTHTELHRTHWILACA